MHYCTLVIPPPPPPPPPPPTPSLPSQSYSLTYLTNLEIYQGGQEIGPVSQLESAVLKSLLHALVSFCPIKTGICRKYKNNPVKPKFMYNMNVQLLRQAVKNSLEFSKPLPFLCLLQNVFQLLVLIVSTQVANTQREKKLRHMSGPRNSRTLHCIFSLFHSTSC